MDKFRFSNSTPPGKNRKPARFGRQITQPSQFVDFFFSSKELHKSISLAHNSSIDICLMAVCLMAICLGALYHTILSIASGKMKKSSPAWGKSFYIFGDRPHDSQ